MHKSEQELIAELVIVRVRSEIVLQKIFCLATRADDDMMMPLLLSMEKLRDRAREIDAQLSKIANDAISETVASIQNQ